MRARIAAVTGLALCGVIVARAEVAPSISRTVELNQQVDMGCIAAAASAVPGIASVARPPAPEAFAASPNDIKVDKFVYVAPGFGGTLTFAPGFLGSSTYFRHTVDFPDGTPTADQVATIRTFMTKVDRALAKHCKIEDLDAAEEQCAAISCPRVR